MSSISFHVNKQRCILSSEALHPSSALISGWPVLGWCLLISPRRTWPASPLFTCFLWSSPAHSPAGLEGGHGAVHHDSHSWYTPLLSASWHFVSWSTCQFSQGLRLYFPCLGSIVILEHSGEQKSKAVGKTDVSSVHRGPGVGWFV